MLFELKRSTAGGDALDQLLRYTQTAGQWTYSKLNDMFQKYEKNELRGTDLAEAHQESLGLPQRLREEDFNRNQRMFVVGSAADQKLIAGVDYWKRQGLAIDFIPYRIFRIGGQMYFEFFSKPYDVHSNPNDTKGIIFDTCRRYYPKALEWMMQKKRISAFGDKKEAVRSFNRGDMVFFSHRWEGIVAAARITGRQVMFDTVPDTGEDEMYWDVRFETPLLTQFDSFPSKLTFADVKKIVGKNFFWARTQKTPFLTREEAELLLVELQSRFNCDGKT
ncbi:hypothetical protein HOV93_38910 [Planctomycetes bacterium FF15]|uniref:EVE domain-containing protein n=1 Tax=Bremerella alba TaxID=980252 RepID=A0A7V8V836_9BACT|nr:hypothetical protein [Bremerella alba]